MVSPVRATSLDLDEVKLIVRPRQTMMYDISDHPILGHPQLSILSTSVAVDAFARGRSSAASSRNSREETMRLDALMQEEIRKRLQHGA